jgi:hypothetical protein
VVGFLVMRHRPDHPIGRLCLGFGAVWIVWILCDTALAYEATHPGSIPRPDLVAALSHPLWVPGVALVAALLLVFPTGTLPTRRWRPVAWVLTAATGLLFVTAFFLPGPVQDRPYENPLGIEAFRFFGTGPGGMVLVVAIIGSLLATAASVVVRFRRSAGIERLQLKWLVAAAVASAVGYAAMFWVSYQVQVLWATIPMAIGFAMHRHRLFDIDRLMNRVVSYALVIGLLALVYTAGVFVLGTISPLEGQVAVAASTLAAFAVFTPLRRRIQHAVDQRFNRSHYDSARVAQALFDGLRDQTDARAIVATWGSTVVATMRPAAIGAWVKRAGG